MAQITLAGKTRHGKNIIQLHGSTFNILKTQEKVLFAPEIGPWILLESLGDTFKKEKHVHWIHEKSDADFTIVNCE